MAAAAALTEAALERQLLEAGNQLLSPPSSTVPELLATLDRVEHLLSLVEQSPSESMRESLSPSTKALIAEDLLRHSDVDIKVAVAACISEITRITAPDAPYEDEQMKEVFQLIVSSFEKLDDRDSPSYQKRVTILETVAKVRSCVVMLDLECDALIVDMFQHFFRSVRDNHNENVIGSLETIMTLVLEESEEIAPELLSPILNVLKKENKEVLSIARQLGEKVLSKCADKVKPFLLQALRSRGDSLDVYCKAVSDVCEARTDAVEPSDGDNAGKNLADENDSVNTPSEKPVEVAVETLEDAPPSEEVGPSTVGSPKSVMSNGTLQKEIDDSSAANGNSKDEDPDTHARKSDVDAEEPMKSQTNPEKSSRRKGRKSHPSKSSSEPAVLDSKPDEVKEPVHEENDSQEVDNVPSEDPEVETAEPAAQEKAHESPVSSPKASDKQPVDSPPSASGSLADETHLKKAGRGRKKGDKKSESVTASVDSKKDPDTKKLSRGAAVPESKSSKRSGKNPSTAADAKRNLSDGKKREDENHGESDTESDMDVDKKIESGSRQREEKKKRGQAKTPAKIHAKTPAKIHAKTPAKDGKKKSALPKSTPKSMEDDSDIERAFKSSSKRKRPREEKAPETKVYGHELIGSVVKVFWPDDEKYYEGVVNSYNSAKKTHEVCYDDGDVEHLKLKKETWKLVTGNFTSQEHISDGESADESADETPKGKKAKTGSDQGAKRGKTVSTTKSGASSSKSKATVKSGSKQKEHSKVDDKSVESPRNLGKSDAGAKGGKSKVSKSGNKLADSPKFSRKTNNDDADTSKTSKSKQDTGKGAAKSKGKSPKSVGKAKAGSSAEEDETEDEQSPEPAEKLGNSKGKSHASPKSQKNSKKRKR